MSARCLSRSGLSPILVALVFCGTAAAQSSRPAEGPATTTKPASPVESLLKSKTLTGDWGGVRTDLEKVGISLNLYYQTQYQQNFHGGLQTHHGHRFSGSYDLKPELDFEKMGLIPGGSFVMEAKGTWGNGINPEKVGALFNPNADIGGDYAIFVNKWWYRQTLLDKRIELRVGMLETKKDLFDVIPYAYHEDKDFLNALSLRSPVIPHRTGMGAFLKLQPADWLYAQAAAIDAESRPRRTGFDTAFHGPARFLGFGELGLTPRFNTAKGPLPGKYYVGAWYDPQPRKVFEYDPRKLHAPEYCSGDMGLYLGAAQMVWKERPDPKDSQGLSLFARAGFADNDDNKVSRSWQVGASYTGLVPTRDADVTGFSVAQAILSRRYRHEVHEQADRETVYELYHQFQITPWFTVSPDLQVITNPGGDKDARDALVGGVRARITF